MDAYQRIVRTDGSRMRVETGARLQFKYAHLDRFWWKFYDAARFELWRLDAQRREAAAACAPGRRSPTACATCCARGPRAEGSPRKRVYPGVQQRPDEAPGHARDVGGLVGRLPAAATRSSGST